MPEFTRPLGDTVRKARLELGYTQNGIAGHLDIDVRTVINIENYKGNPKLEILFPLIRALKINPTEIFYPELRRNSPAMHQLQLLMTDCSDSEADALLSVCQSVLSVLREKKGLTVEE